MLLDLLHVKAATGGGKKQKALSHDEEVSRKIYPRINPRNSSD
jgi:hypothetical protein